MKNKKFNLKIFIAAILMLTVCLTVSYGAFIVVKNQTETNMITSACFSSSFTDSNSISLTGVNAL